MTGKLVGGFDSHILRRMQVKPLLVLLFVATFLSTLFLPVIIYFTLYRDISAMATNDFNQYMASARMLREGTISQIYNPQVFSQYRTKIVYPYKPSKLIFRSLPYVSFFYLPFSFFNYQNAYASYLVFSFALLVLNYLILIRFFPHTFKIKYGFLLILSFLPTIFTLIQGQSSILMLTIILLGFYGIAKKRFFISGLVLSLLLFKIHIFVTISLLLIVYLKKRGFILGISTGSLIILAFNALLTSPKTLLNYPLYIFQTETAGFGTHLSQYLSLYSIFNHLAVTIILFLVTVFIIYKLPPSKNIFSSLSAISILALLFAYHTPPYELTVLVFSLFYFLNHYFSKKSLYSLIFSVLIFIVPMSLINIVNNRLVTLFLILIGYYLLIKPILPVQNPKLFLPPPSSKS